MIRMRVVLIFGQLTYTIIAINTSHSYTTSIHSNIMHILSILSELIRIPSLIIFLHLHL